MESYQSRHYRRSAVTPERRGETPPNHFYQVPPKRAAECFAVVKCKDDMFSALGLYMVM